jgi:hypothetical protein
MVGHIYAFIWAIRDPSLLLKAKKVHSVSEQSCLVCEIRAHAVAAANVGRTHLGIFDEKKLSPFNNLYLMQQQPCMVVGYIKPEPWALDCLAHAIVVRSKSSHHSSSELSTHRYLMHCPYPFQSFAWPFQGGTSRTVSAIHSYTRLS